MERPGLEVRRWPSPAPPAARILRHARPDDRPFALISGPGDPCLSTWSYAGLTPVAIAPSIGRAHQIIAGWFDEPALVPFAGGAVGYLGYDLGWALAPRPRVPRPDPLGMPPAQFLIYDAIYARNERTGEGYLLAQPNVDSAARLDRLARALSEDGDEPRGVARQLAPRISEQIHRARIEEALQLIAAGEVYQVNLTYPLVGSFDGDPRAAFLRLLSAPPTFAAFLHVGEDQFLVSASPECFFDLNGRSLSTYPIKGTRPRSNDPIVDRALARELEADEKERAEHLMIVDLLRNDVGRSAQIGSVNVAGLAYVESFPGVHHLTSRVDGLLREGEGIDLSSVLRALFPGGSITGAPKLRAMEIIDALENAPRGVYTGAIGYVTPSGSVRTSIAIRTAQLREGELLFGVGGGIVADSDPHREWEETVLKSRALRAALCD